MIVVYPHDPSTLFLKEIVEKIKPFITSEVDRAMPDAYDKTISFINSHQKATLIFLGHGFSEGLYGGCYVADGKQILITKDIAIKSFRNRKVILLCCRSSEFIIKIENTFEVAIGFGNIKTSKEDLTSKADKEKFKDYKILELFRKNLVDLFANSIVEATRSNYSFYQFYKGLKLRMNKAICNYSLSKDLNENLAGQLLFELKREMLIIGNEDTLILTKV